MRCARCHRSLRLGIVMKMLNGRKATYGPVCATKVEGEPTPAIRFAPAAPRSARGKPDDRQTELFGVVA